MPEIPPHPAKFSDAILNVVYRHLPDVCDVLDPFAGVGTVHNLMDMGDKVVCTWGVEIEPEWANAHPRTYVGNAHDLSWVTAPFDVVVTSPVYGNRMSDHHEAKDASDRITYRHKLGRPLHPDNAGQLHWGPAYWEFHRRAYAEMVRVVKPGGLIILNVSDFIANKQKVMASNWHINALCFELGCDLIACEQVPTKRMRKGANAAARVPYEEVLVFRTPDVGEVSATDHNAL